MKKTCRVTAVLVFIFLMRASLPAIAAAQVESRTIKQMSLDAKFLDIAPSGDGKSIFLLAPGEILIYSLSADKVTDRIQVDKAFDKLALFSKTDVLMLSSTSTGQVKIIEIEKIHQFDTAGLPVKGPGDAGVTIAVFNDYQ